METDSANLLKQLQSTLCRLEKALGAIADAVVWTDAEQRIERCNPAFSRLVNRFDPNVVGSCLRDVLPLQQAGNFLAITEYPDAKLRAHSYEPTLYEFHPTPHTPHPTPPHPTPHTSHPTPHTPHPTPHTPPPRNLR
ncbi:hypothetical protein K9N68_16070 [Kovacikia minuta CCNUW1]|uniref:PAS domain-containing protein n=1 Tax=Kovacikia minuta TaxID=2931930 RepID=UPI001CCCFAB3|nr:PAS domain-containing protein [Kovacikia minuta]UBF29212.1 hypothetical protein K9N68_16070 [Kovacikia minuta CCNUW1]